MVGSQCFTPQRLGGGQQRRSLATRGARRGTHSRGRWTHQPNPHFKQFLACMCTSRRTLDLRRRRPNVVGPRGGRVGTTRRNGRVGGPVQRRPPVARHGRWERGGHLQHRRAGVLGWRNDLDSFGIGFRTRPKQAHPRPGTTPLGQRTHVGGHRHRPVSDLEWRRHVLAGASWSSQGPSMAVAQRGCGGP